jgi:hypothetical protein
VYGQGDDGKPRGARFPVTEMETLFPVVEKLNLKFYEGCTEQLTELGMKLPAGRIYARGKCFIPNIRQPLYDQILAGLAEFQKTAAEGKAERIAAADAERAKTGAKEPLILKGLPADWQSIGSGHLILAEEEVGDGEGYWECIVVNRQDDILTLKFRDYPKAPQFQRHLSNVAVLHPGPTK